MESEKRRLSAKSGCVEPPLSAAGRSLRYYTTQPTSICNCNAFALTCQAPSVLGSGLLQSRLPTASVILSEAPALSEAEGKNLDHTSPVTLVEARFFVAALLLRN